MITHFLSLCHKLNQWYLHNSKFSIVHLTKHHISIIIPQCPLDNKVNCCSPTIRLMKTQLELVIIRKMNEVMFWEYAPTLVANYSVLVDSISERIKAWPINNLSCRQTWTHKGCHSRDIMLLASDSLHSFLVSLTKFTCVGNSCGQITIHWLPGPLFVKKKWWYEITGFEIVE